MSKIKACELLYVFEVIGCLPRKLEDDKITDIELLLNRLPKKQVIQLREIPHNVSEWLN